MRSRKALLNTVSSLLVQLASVIVGFVVPIAYIGTFGSETYGAIGTINQYLGFIALLEAGVGGVTRAALYKPLAEGRIDAVSSIVRATERFFRTIGGVFVGYSIIIACIFPFITYFTGEWVLSFALTLVIAAGTLAQYMFGITYSLLLQADQRSYVANVFQVVSSVANAAVIVVMVRAGFDVVVVQAGSSFVFVLRPVILGAYVRRKYRLVKDAVPDKTAIADRWNGLGHHLAFYLRSNIATIALSMFAPLTEVSVFAVYNLIAQGLQRLVNAFSSGVEAAFGNMIANGEREALQVNFRVYEVVSSTLVAVVFSTAIATVQPFLAVYMKGVTDANYQQPLLGVVLLAATAVYCFRLPYNSVVLAAGHYRQTRNGAFAEAGICVALSFLLAGPFGATGVSTALLVATVFRTLQYGVYASRVILERPLRVFAGRCLYILSVTTACSLLGLYAGTFFNIGGYCACGLLALGVVALSSLLVVLSLHAFYPQDLMIVLEKMKRIFSGSGEA